jgi:ribulose-5-phosphate 4-epimerase/fuculose-1-phosphate aldolase
MSDDQIVEKVAQACRILGRLDLTHAALGHVSYRAGDEDSMIIKSKGPQEVGLRYTDPSDVIRVNFEAEKIEGGDGLQAPGESFLHLHLYKTRPEVRSIVHIHPEDCLIMGLSKKKLRPQYVGYDPSSAKILAAGVPIYKSAVTIHDHEKGIEFANFVSTANVAIMRGHGITVLGNSIEDATVRAINLCRAVHIAYRMALIGRTTRLSKSELRSLTATRERGNRGSVEGAEGLASRWGYYAELTGSEKVHPG